MGMYLEDSLTLVEKCSLPKWNISVHDFLLPVYHTPHHISLAQNTPCTHDISFKKTRTNPQLLPSIFIFFIKDFLSGDSSLDIEG